MTISAEDQAVIEREAHTHANLAPWSLRPIPRSVTYVNGCNCGGTNLHRVDCSIGELDREQILANIDAANERSIAYCAEITRIQRSVNQ